MVQNVGPIVGEDAVGEMLAHFPVTEGEQPVTKDHLDARMNELRVELHQEINRLLIWVPASIAAICAVIAFVTRLTV